MDVRALTGADREAILAWRYPGRYSTYDFDDPAALDSDTWAVCDDGALIGYCCFGAAARVPGTQEEEGVLDVGYGLAPELMGRGLGLRFVAAILQFAVDRHRPERLRLLILDWNERSRKVAERHGFTAESVLPSDEGSFVVMER